MNVLFCIIMIISIVLICINEPNNAVSFMLQGSEQAVKLTIKLIAIYSLWTGLLQIITDSGIEQWLSKKLKPVMGKIFKGETSQTHSLIALNFTANLLGLGGGATTAGIKATSLMAKDNTKITKNLMLFFIINVSSIQLLPTTVITMRASFGSENPSNIILPSFIASAFTTLVGILLVVVIENLKDRFCKKKSVT